MHIRFIRTLLFALVVLCMSTASFGQIGVAIMIGPPALPVYEQPLCPGDGYLWTPGYWAYDYGFGYFGDGYEGGRWDNGHFFYNRSVNNVNITEIHNVYNTTIRNTTVNRISYNGGNGGISARPTAEQEAAAHERHIAPAAVQTQHEQTARANPQQRASANMGKPGVAATP